MKHLSERQETALIAATFGAFLLLCVFIPCWLAGIIVSLGFTWTCDKIEDKQVRAYLRDQEARRLLRLQRRYESGRADWWR